MNPSDPQQRKLWFEDIYDAFKEIVKVGGGMKKVADLMWPTNPRGPQLLADCLNPKEREKLALEDVIWLLRFGRELGCHEAINYICEQAGYDKPKPIDPKDEAVELQRRVDA